MGRDGQTGAAIDVFDRLLELEGAALHAEGAALAEYAFMLAELLVREGRREEAISRLEACADEIEGRTGASDVSERLRAGAGQIRDGK